MCVQGAVRQQRPHAVLWSRVSALAIVAYLCPSAQGTAQPRCRRPKERPNLGTCAKWVGRSALQPLYSHGRLSHACIVMAYILMAGIAMACIVAACSVMVCTVMAYIGMRYMVLGDIIMGYIMGQRLVQLWPIWLWPA